MNKKLRAIILAAGKGSRFGGPKIYQKIKDEYFIEVIYHKLLKAGISNIAVVVFPGCELERFLIKDSLKWIINPNPALGMLSSIYHGVNDDDSFDGYLIMPVDHPIVEAQTFLEMKEYFYMNAEFVIKPRWKNKAGHPIIIPGTIANEIKLRDYDGGLNKFISSSKFTVKYISVGDPGIIQNINTKEDIENLNSDVKA